MVDLPRKDEQGRNYLSFSQIKNWKEDFKEYVRQYFFGEEFEGNAYTDFGSMIGEALEKGDFSGFDDKEVTVLSMIPRLDDFEREVKYEYEDFYVKGYIDTSTRPATHIIDYKTGALNKESYYSSDKYTQLVIYSAAIQQEEGKLPEKAEVVLIEREGNSFKRQPLTLGTTVVNIEQDISQERVDKVMKDIEQIAYEISEMYRVFKEANFYTV